MPKSADIIVAGGGVIGLSCAWRLAQAGLHVTLLERTTCGSGASLAALGALWPPSPLATGKPQQMHRASLESFPAFAGEISRASALPVTYRQLGRLEIILDENHLARAKREAGHGLQILSPAEVLTMEPHLTPPALGAQWSAKSAQVRVDELIPALVQACRNAGVTILENTPLISLQTHQAVITGVETAEGSIAAPRVLIAMGAWTTVASIKPVRGQGLLFSTAQPLISHIIKRGSTYLIPWDRQILVGSTTEPAAGFDCRTTPEGISGLRTAATAMLPALANATLEKTWAGLRPDGPHHKPIIGPVCETSGLFVAAGHFKTGIGMAPETSRIVAKLMGK